jgi:hypothetical protein
VDPDPRGISRCCGSGSKGNEHEEIKGKNWKANNGILKKLLSILN